jgi:dihydrolipoamide dehydrogenase
MPHAAKLIIDFRGVGPWGLEFSPPRIDIDTLRGHWTQIVENLSKNLLDLSKRRKVEFLRARATFEDSHTVGLRDGTRGASGIASWRSVPARPASRG